jgi:hypothetical protein
VRGAGIGSVQRGPCHTLHADSHRIFLTSASNGVALQKTSLRRNARGHLTSRVAACDPIAFQLSPFSAHSSAFAPSRCQCGPLPKATFLRAHERTHGEIQRVQTSWRRRQKLPFADGAQRGIPHTVFWTYILRCSGEVCPPQIGEEAVSGILTWLIAKCGL